MENVHFVCLSVNVRVGKDYIQDFEEVRRILLK